MLSASAFATVVQQGTLRVSIATRVKPYRLPRADPAPIKVLIAGHVWTSTGAVPPQLTRLTVLINRHGELRPGSIPSCTISQIRPSTTAQAIERCGPALVGSGHFWASVVLPEQGVYHTTGRLLAFNGTIGGRPAFLAQIYTTQPFPSSFVVPFSIRHIDRGPYGTELSGSLPQALGEWGFVDRIKMTLGREATIGGRTHSYLRASCPAPKGTDGASFSLALAHFYFAGGEQLEAGVPKSCGVKE
ncbi:MAG TPA: hypothetical protein VMF55_08060 [Solirubrobacterales bacterium]|nr:hypothetical protein [Solirubrobacterales bacterium]